MSIDNPIINGPFDEPERYFEMGPDGPTGQVLSGRRRSESWIPVPAARKDKGKGQVQEALDFDLTGERREENPLINRIRSEVDAWREHGYLGATPITRKFLEHWADPSRGSERVLFCQREAAETAIYLTEIAGRSRESRSQMATANLRKPIDEANAIHNARLPRMAHKMATGTGKTVVMGMLIAWQTINHEHSKRDARFTNRFLVVTPGITIRDRLRVLYPNDIENVYQARDLVPPDLWPQLLTARISITNYHTFLPRDRQEIKGVSTTTRKILTHGKNADPFKETEADVVSRVLRDIGSARGDGPKLMVINDEAHHCYMDKPIEAKLDSEEQDRNEEARVWFKGLQAIHRKVGIKSIIDLSATPYYLGGSGYAEGYIFPWTVSDFSLMDAIESGVVKVPRLPIDDDAAGPQVSYLNLWDQAGKLLPKRKTKDAVDGSGWQIPAVLEGALRSLYRSYEKSFEHWRENLASHGEPPPVMIIVCPNTIVSKLVYEWVAGVDVSIPGDDSGTLVPKDGNLSLFSNVEGGRWLGRPPTLLIDSARLESGEALTPDFKAAAAREIEVFKNEIRRRDPGADVEKLTDEDILREVMNTVGKPGRLGADTRCVVSVAMLTEGWDANTVTHILGIRAFTSQLLCEQVVGRGLRRRNYAVNDDGKFEAEYAQVYGVPFSFVAGEPGPEPKPAPPALRVASVPGREHLRIRFPKLDGYRIEIPDEDLNFDVDHAQPLEIKREDVALWTESAGIVGVVEVQDLRAEYESKREQEVAFAIAKQVVDDHLRRGGEARPWLFPRTVDVTREWMRSKLKLEPDVPIGFLMIAERQREAAEAVYRSIVTYPETRRERLKPMIRPFDPIGDTGSVSFFTRKPAVPTEKSEVGYVVLDGHGGGGNTWEQLLATECELSSDVYSYVKNDHVGFVIPYVHKGISHNYFPDFLIHLTDQGDGLDRYLIVEVSGSQKSPGPTRVKAETARNQWCTSVNNHGGFGRWGYLEVTDPTTIRARLNEAIKSLRSNQDIIGDPDLLDLRN